MLIRINIKLCHTKILLRIISLSLTKFWFSTVDLNMKNKLPLIAIYYENNKNIHEIRVLPKCNRDLIRNRIKPIQ